MTEIENKITLKINIEQQTIQFILIKKDKTEEIFKLKEDKEKYPINISIERN